MKDSKAGRDQGCVNTFRGCLHLDHPEISPKIGSEIDIRLHLGALTPENKTCARWGRGKGVCREILKWQKEHC